MNGAKNEIVIGKNNEFLKPTTLSVASTKYGL